jgi:serine/threonine protein kinase
MFRDAKCKVPVIVDFGYAVYSDDEDYAFYRCGTPGFLSPEIFQMEKHSKITPISDVFSIGAVYHILLVKRCLFPGKEARNVYENNKNLIFDLSQTIYDSINPSAMDLLKRMLAVDSKNRLKAS